MRTSSLFALLLIASPAAGQALRFRDVVMPPPLVIPDVPYGSAFNRSTNQPETLRLDLYEQPNDPLRARPAVMALHGGGFRSGDKSDTAIVALCTDLSRRGYVAVSINYRLQVNGSIGRQAITDAKEDAKAAVRWLRANAGLLRIDPDRIASIGDSAGAVAVLEAAYVDGEGQSGNPGWPSHVRAVVDLWGQLSSLNTLDPGEPPVCIVHGQGDSIVPYFHATALAARAQQVGVPFELHPLNAGHTPWHLLAQFLPDVVAFLHEHLALAQVWGLVPHVAPPVLRLDTCGVAGDGVVLCLAAASAPPLWFGRLGQLGLAPHSLITLPVGTLPGAPRLPVRSLHFYLPPTVRGTIWWQALHTRQLTPRTLTNSLGTTF